MSIHTSKAHLLEYLWKAAIETDQEIQSKFVQDFKWIYTDIFLQYSLTISHVAVIPAVHTYNWVRLSAVKLCLWDLLAQRFQNGLDWDF